VAVDDDGSHYANYSEVGQGAELRENAMKFHCGNKTFTSILNKAAEAVG